MQTNTKRVRILTDEEKKRRSEYGKIYNKTKRSKEPRSLEKKAELAKYQKHYRKNKMTAEQKEARRKNRKELTPEAKERKKDLERKRLSTPEGKAWAAARHKRRMSSPINRLSSCCRARIKEAFKRNGFRKNGATEKMLGCSFEFLKSHIESQFMKGMSWENMGFHVWHIDHIMPLSAAATPKEILKYSHFSNLRPLWAKENLCKGSKIITHQPELLLEH